MKPKSQLMWASYWPSGSIYAVTPYKLNSRSIRVRVTPVTTKPVKRKKNKIMEISRERFEAYIFNQPLDRTYNYFDQRGCVLCCFIRETTSLKNPRVGGFDYYENCTSEETRMEMIGKPGTRLPDWFVLLMIDGETRHNLTIANMQARYIELFGNPFPPTPEPEQVKTVIVKDLTVVD